MYDAASGAARALRQSRVSAALCRFLDKKSSAFQGRAARPRVSRDAREAPVQQLDDAPHHAHLTQRAGAWITAGLDDSSNLRKRAGKSLCNEMKVTEEPLSVTESYATAALFALALRETLYEVRKHFLLIVTVTIQNLSPWLRASLSAGRRTEYAFQPSPGGLGAVHAVAEGPVGQRRSHAQGLRAPGLEQTRLAGEQRGGGADEAVSGAKQLLLRRPCSCPRRPLRSWSGKICRGPCRRSWCAIANCGRSVTLPGVWACT